MNWRPCDLPAWRAYTRKRQQEEAAIRMNISKATFGRMINAAHRKVADAIIHGKALTIESKSVEEY